MSMQFWAWIAIACGVSRTSALLNAPWGPLKAPGRRPNFTLRYAVVTVPPKMLVFCEIGAWITEIASKSLAGLAGVGGNLTVV